MTSRNKRRAHTALLVTLSLPLGPSTFAAPSSSTMPPKLRITSPAQGAVIERQLGCETDSKLVPVSGTLRGFRKTDFESGRYTLFVNGYPVPASMITSPPYGSLASFTVPSAALPYYPTVDRGSSTPEALMPPARYPWTAELSLGWDKRVRAILAEVVESSDSFNLDRYVLRDLITYIDSRISNCEHHEFSWKTPEQSAEGSLSIQFTPKHLKALEPVVKENTPAPTMSLGPDFPLASTPADPRCKKVSDLSIGELAAARSEILEVYAAAAASGSRARNLYLCVSEIESTLTDVEFKRPNSVTINPSVDPLTVDLFYSNVESYSRTRMTYYVYGSLGIYRSSENTIRCNRTAKTDLDFTGIPLLFRSRAEETYASTPDEIQADRKETTLSDSDQVLCDMSILDSHRVDLKRELRKIVTQIYEGTLNAGYSTSDYRNAFTNAVDAAIYPLSPGKAVSDAGSGTRQSIVPIEIQYRSGNPSLCEEPLRGLHVSYQLLNEPSSVGSPLGWGSWNGDDLLRILGNRFSQSTCPIIRRDGSIPVFDPEQKWSATVQQSTSQLNQILAARSGQKFQWTLNTLSDPDGNRIANALGIPVSDTTFIEVSGGFPPLVSPEWYFQFGHIQLIAIDRSSGRDEVIVKAIASAILDASLLESLFLGVGDTESPDDLQGVESISPNRYLIQYTSVSSGDLKPTSATLASAFDPFLQPKLTNYLLRSIRLLPSPEYFSTPPSGTPRFVLRTWAPSTLSPAGALFFPSEFSSP